MRPRTLAAVPALTMTMLLVAGCAGGSGSGDSAAEPAAGRDAPPAAQAESDGLRALDAPQRDANSAAGDTDARAVPDYRARSVISTGTMTLRSDDVGQAKFDLMKVVDGHRGEISDEQTETDDDGAISRSRLVVRVPSGDFDEAMDELAKLPATDLRSAERTSEDVTTKVIDTDIRVRAQEKSIERIEALLARARSIKDIVWIESQLTRRQAELDSLKSQQAWLADQTSLSTITVFLEQTPDRPVVRKQRDQAGFLTGLDAGWGALVKAGTGLATVSGALLPFAVVALVLGVPGWLLLRPVLRRRRVGAEPAPAD